jgi:hypothetical protein
VDVTIDGKPDPASGAVGPGESFGAVFGRVTASIEAGGRTVTSIEVDGQPLTEELAERVRSQPAEKVRALSITTADLAAVSADLLGEIDASLRRLENAGANLARRFQAGAVDEALKDLPAFIEAWNVIVQGLAHVARLSGARLETMTIGDRTAADAIAGMVTVVKAWVDAFRHKDYVTVGDGLEYDLPEQIKAMRAVSEVLAAAAVKKKEGGKH